MAVASSDDVSAGSLPRVKLMQPFATAAMLRWEDVRQYEGVVIQREWIHLNGLLRADISNQTCSTLDLDI